MPAQHRSSTRRSERSNAKNENSRKQAKEAFAELSRKVHCDEAAGHIKTGNYTKALNGYNVALELNPTDKNALVARSKCYLLLGEPELALKDAESALEGDKKFVKAIYQKAEALYHLGNFEHSLMYYHRGLRIRPELEGFRLGVQKAQEAIENTIGGKVAMPFALSTVMELQKNGLSNTSGENKSTPGSGKAVRHSATSKSASSDNKSRPSSKTNKADRRLLGELCVDKEYLEQLLKHPDLRCPHQENSPKNQITKYAEEGIAFLKNRQEFWRQQRSNTSIIPMKENSSKRHNHKESANESNI